MSWTEVSCKSHFTHTHTHYGQSEDGDTPSSKGHRRCLQPHCAPHYPHGGQEAVGNTEHKDRLNLKAKDVRSYIYTPSKELGQDGKNLAAMFLN